MAVGNLTNWSKNTEFDQVVQAGYISTVFRNNRFLGLFPSKQSPGGSQYEWRINSAANTSVEVFSEGAPAAAPDVQTFVMASLSYIFFRGSTRVTSHVRRALRAGSQALPAGFSVIPENLRLLLEDIRDLQQTTFMGTSNNGIQLAVDSAGTYATIDRSSATHWQSYENARGGAMVWAVFMDAREAAVDAERGARSIGMWLMAPNQLSNLQTLPVAPGQSNSAFRYDLTASGGDLNLLPTLDGTRLGEGIAVSVPDLTNTVIIGLPSDAMPYYVEHGPLDVRTWAAASDDVTMLEVAGTLVIPNPRKCTKETSVTA